MENQKFTVAAGCCAIGSYTKSGADAWRAWLERNGKMVVREAIETFSEGGAMYWTEYIAQKA